MVFIYVIICIVIFPLTAFAYFDPGFGGNLVNSISNFIISGIAFLTAALIYFFRIIIGQGFCCIWHKYRRIVVIILFFTLVGISLGIVYVFFASKTSKDVLDFKGTQIINAQRMYDGYNFFEGKLIDQKGQVVKQWSKISLGVIDTNGDYYGAQENNGSLSRWGRYTWDDRVIWEKNFPIHHQIYLSPVGTVFTFSQELHNYNSNNVFFDVILEFDKDGHEIQRYSLADHLKEFKPYHPVYSIDVPIVARLVKLFAGSSEEPYDYFHLNSFSMVPPNPLQGMDPAFRPGNWIISLLHGSMVFILDKDTKKILWHVVANEVEGGIQRQHAVTMMPDGNILLFDNGYLRKSSRVLIIDPLTRRIKWQYKQENFYSPWEGYVQSLPNGNLLVTDTKNAYAFELTRDKEIVWEYYDPDKSISVHSKKDKSKQQNHEDKLYFMMRYPKEMIEHFLRTGR